MKDIFYRQCRMSRKNEIQVSWIPEKFAVQNKVLKLKNYKDEWENGWIVENVGSSRVEESLLPDPHIDIKQHRKNTGDSMKK